MDFAGRADKYPGIKTNFVPKVGAKWTATDTLAFRGTYAEGFRAPALSQVTPGGAQFFLSGVYDPKRCQEDESDPTSGWRDGRLQQVGLGRRRCQSGPEAGNVEKLLAGPDLFADQLARFRRRRVQGAQGKRSGAGYGSEALKNEDRCPENVLRDQNPANFITDANGMPIPGTGTLLSVKTPWSNQGATELRGVDLEARMRNKLGECGSLSTALRGTYVYSYKLAQHEGDMVNNVTGTRPGLYDWQLSTSAPTCRSVKASLTTNWNKWRP